MNPVFSRYFQLLIALAFLLGLNLSTALGQEVHPVHWSFKAIKTSGNTYDLVLSGKIDKGWHTFPQAAQVGPDGLGPNPTEVIFKSLPTFKLIGKVVEKSKPTLAYDKGFDIKDLRFYNNEVVFVQKVQIVGNAKSIQGSVTFQCCNESMCIAPETVDFTFSLGGESGSTTSAKISNDNEPKTESTSSEVSPFKPVSSNPINPVKWSYEVNKGKKGLMELHFIAKIDKGYHIYGLKDSDLAPKIHIRPKSANYDLEGKVEAITKPILIYDSALSKKVTAYEGSAEFFQRIKLHRKTDTIIATIKARASNNKEVVKSKAQKFYVQSKELKNVDNLFMESLWWLFGQGIIGGLLALLTPCVFPMIPMTVSFFTKRGTEKKKGIGTAVLYGVSIILIYVFLGIVVSKLFGSDKLNSLASNVYFNMAFFIIFMIFGFSFLGAFDITLPSSWTTAADRQSEKGGLIGVFFMAFTLVLVSFSCTGPVVGSLLVIAAEGGTQGPIAGMFGFSLALALPFTIFAIFPNLMNSLPKSGGWLNSVKVTLGFIELALAMKFLSAVDLAYHWDFFYREYFIATWVVIFGILGLYLLGKIKFSHDSDLPYVSVPRLLVAILSLSFSIYLIPGLWGAPVNLISGLAPPTNYTEGAFYTASTSEAMDTVDAKTKVKDTASSASIPTGAIDKPTKYTTLHGAKGINNTFFDYDEALAVARKFHKPLMIDFTGHACTNCRKMENTVWQDPRVQKILNEGVILASLYVDDKTDLPAAEVYKSSSDNRTISSLGGKNSDLQKRKCGKNSQPQYVLLDKDGEELNSPREYDPPTVESYIKWLEEGIEEYKDRENE